MIYDETGLKIDAPSPQGGNTDTGNLTWRVFSSECLPAITQILTKFRVKEKDALLRIHHSLSIILRVASSKRRVDIEPYRDLCRQTYLLIVESLPWAKVTECLHDVLGHSAEAIERNDGFGLGNFTEQGSEGTNKYIRRYSERGARQTSLQANIEDVMQKLIVRSDPVVLSFARSPFRSRCNSQDHWAVSCPTKSKDTDSAASSKSLDEEVESLLLTQSFKSLKHFLHNVLSL